MASSMRAHKKKDKKRLTKFVCPPYHKRSELLGRAGYYPNLSAAQKDCVLQICAKLQAAHVTLESFLENEHLQILRFLRARCFDVNATFAMLKEHIAWQKKMKGLYSIDQSDESCCQRTSMLQCLPVFFDFCPWWFHGVDRQARPLVWGACGKFELWRITELTTLDNIHRLFSWGGCQLEQRLAAQSRHTGCNIETAVIILDAAGWNLGLATKESFSFIQSLVQIGNEHFPERLGRLLVINAPPVLSFAWKVVSGFLDSVTRAKVQLLNHPDEWLPVLRDLAEQNQIPRKYGGTADDMSSGEAIATLSNIKHPLLSILPTQESQGREEQEQRPSQTPREAEAQGRSVSLSMVKEALERKLSLVDHDTLDTSLSERRADMQQLPPDGKSQSSNVQQQGVRAGGGRSSAHHNLSSLTSSSSPPLTNLTIINPPKRRRDKSGKNNASDTFSDESFASLSGFGKWVVQSLRLSAPGGEDRCRNETGRRPQRRGPVKTKAKLSLSSSGGDGDGDDDDDASHSSASSSVLSRSSSVSSAVSSTSSVYDEEGGNVLHCRQEDNLTPLPIAPMGASSCDDVDDNDMLTSWLHTDAKWKFNASTQTDISSFDPRFVFTKRSDCSDWTHFFTCITGRRKGKEEQGTEPEF